MEFDLIQLIIIFIIGIIIGYGIRDSGIFE